MCNVDQQNSGGKNLVFTCALLNGCGEGEGEKIQKKTKIIINK
jgi:hypothetical protein